VEQMFEDIHLSFKDLKTQLSEDTDKQVEVDRVFTHDIIMTIEDVGTYEVYTVPNDGSQIILIDSPIHPNGLLPFKWDENYQKWIFIDTDGNASDKPMCI